MAEHDASGALPVHALLIANTDTSVELAFQWFKRQPSLLPLVHGAGPYRGENNLHILAANRREDSFIRLLKMAVARLAAPELTTLLTAMTSGSFFDTAPMAFYGGSPLSYTVCFGMRKALYTMLTNKKIAALVGLNERPCTTSGFYPLHAAVACGLSDFYDLLLELPPAFGKTVTLEQRADSSLRTSRGRSQLRLLGLTPLQLATRLGDRRMFMHILHRRMVVQWKWGPVTQYQCTLDEIDSVGSGGNDVMELVAHMESLPQCQELLLDDFMQGFIYQLFAQKWSRYGRFVHYMLAFCQLLCLVAVVVLAFGLKEHPATVDRRALPFCVILTIVINAALEILIAFEWYRSVRGSQEGLRHMGSWLQQFSLAQKGIASATALAACIIIFSETDGACPNWDSGGGSSTAAALSGCHDGFGSGDEKLWVLLATSLFLQSWVVIHGMLSPAPYLGIYVHIATRMLKDVIIFVTLLIFFLVSFYSAMYVVFPRAGAGTFLAVSTPFNTWDAALKTMFDMALVGVKWSPELSVEIVEELDTWQLINYLLFILLYCGYVLTVVILMLRLLIAMLSNTFNSVERKSTLEWRLLLARRVLRAELLYPYPRQMRAGEEVDGQHLFFFRHVDKNAEGVDFKCLKGQGNRSNLSIDAPQLATEKAKQWTEPSSRIATILLREGGSIKSTLAEAVAGATAAEDDKQHGGGALSKTLGSSSRMLGQGVVEQGVVSSLNTAAKGASSVAKGSVVAATGGNMRAAPPPAVADPQRRPSCRRASFQLPSSFSV